MRVAGIAGISDDDEMILEVLGNVGLVPLERTALESAVSETAGDAALRRRDDDERPAQFEGGLARLLDAEPPRYLGPLPFAGQRLDDGMQVVEFAFGDRL